MFKAESQVGDVVRVRDDLEVGKIYGGMTWIFPEMSNTAGRIAKIVHDQSCASSNKRLDISEFYYSTEMLQRPFDLDAFKRGEFSVNCETDEDRKAFLSKCYDKSIQWSDGKEPVNYFKANTCYSCWSDGKLVYCDIGYERNVAKLPVINYKNLYFEEGKTMDYGDFMAGIIQKYSVMYKHNEGEVATMSNLDKATQELQKAQEQLTKAQQAVEAARKEEEKAKEPWHGLKPGDVLYRVVITFNGAVVSRNIYGCDADEHIFQSGFGFALESDAQRMADMMNYCALVGRKAREVNGLLGHGHDDMSGRCGYTVIWGSIGIGRAETNQWTERHPMTPIMTKGCAESLAEDPEIIAAAKKAWGIKE